MSDSHLRNSRMWEFAIYFVVMVAIGVLIALSRI